MNKSSQHKHIYPPQIECPGNSKVHSRLDNERLCESQFPTASLLTSMTILPTGEPSAVMSKKTRGIDILYVGGVMHGISLDRDREEKMAGRFPCFTRVMACRAEQLFVAPCSHPAKFDSGTLPTLQSGRRARGFRLLGGLKRLSLKRGDRRSNILSRTL